MRTVHNNLLMIEMYCIAPSDNWVRPQVPKVGYGLPHKTGGKILAGYYILVMLLKSNIYTYP